MNYTTPGWGQEYLWLAQKQYQMSMSSTLKQIVQEMVNVFIRISKAMPEYKQEQGINDLFLFAKDKSSSERLQFSFAGKRYYINAAPLITQDSFYFETWEVSTKSGDNDNLLRRLTIIGKTDKVDPSGNWGFKYHFPNTNKTEFRESELAGKYLDEFFNYVRDDESKKLKNLENRP